MNDFDVVPVKHDGIHEQELGLKKGYNDRCTWCSKCGRPVIWERINKIEEYKTIKD